MIRFRALPLALFCVATATLQTACEKRTDPVTHEESWHFTGQPDPAKKWKPVSAITDFKTLFSQNCIACHGSGPTVGGVIALDNQTFLNLVTADYLKTTITNGVKGTRMAAFGKAEGGGLTADQIDILVNGILAQRKPLDPSARPLPPFSAPLGNAVAGGEAFKIFCATCHGVDGTGGRIAGSVVNPAYLGLVSDQYLRTIVIAGRPDLGMPAPTNMPMTDQQVSDIVAWLVSHRTNEFGQPLAAPVP